MSSLQSGVMCVMLSLFLAAAASSQNTKQSSSSGIGLKDYCKDDNDCGKGKFCHPFLKACFKSKANELVKTGHSKHRKNTIPITAAIPPPDCKEDKDCSGANEYCHNIHKLCLEYPASEPITGTTVPLTHKITECNDEEDCKDTETCHLFPRGPRSRRRLARVACHDVPNPSAGCTRQVFYGICIDKKLLDSLRNQAGNCSNSTDCGANMCCITSKGVCMNHRRRGELCVVQDVWFSCKCGHGLVCVSRGKRVNARKLAERLQLHSELMKPLTNKETKRRKYEVGKCESV